nr:15901_t:CDS:2 [Entrophospora candida]
MVLGGSSKNEDVTEPLSIELNKAISLMICHKHGLGMSAELKQKAKVGYERRTKKIKVDENTFRERIRQ